MGGGAGLFRRRALSQSGPTSRTTACCATTRPTARSACSASRRGNSNGNTVDRQGRLVTCEHSGRRVSRTEHDGSVTTIADRYKGKRLNSPNDVVVKSDGSIWFTDPTYGIDTDYEGDKAESEIGGSHVYRVDPASGEVEAVVTDMVQPNGLAFSLDETPALRRRYRPHAWRAEPGAYAGIRRQGRQQGCRAAASSPTATAGLFDGFRLDERGRIWTSAGDGIHCYDPDGTLIGKVKVPEVTANCVFGGIKRNALYIAGTTSLYRVRLMVNGAKTY